MGMHQEARGGVPSSGPARARRGFMKPLESQEPLTSLPCGHARRPRPRTDTSSHTVGYVCMYVCDYIAVSLVRTLTSPASWDARYAVASAKASAVPATTTR